MAKAIHWPDSFRETVLSEGEEALYCAVRLGRLYFDNRFWVDQEEVDIRVNHLKIRRGVVQGELLCMTIDELPEMVLQRLKPGLQTKDELIPYLKETYPAGGEVTLQTVVTVVTYKNLPVVAEEIETP